MSSSVEFRHASACAVMETFVDKNGIYILKMIDVTDVEPSKRQYHMYYNETHTMTFLSADGKTNVSYNLKISRSPRGFVVYKDYLVIVFSTYVLICDKQCKELKRINFSGGIISFGSPNGDTFLINDRIHFWTSRLEHIILDIDVGVLISTDAKVEIDIAHCLIEVSCDEKMEYLPKIFNTYTPDMNFSFTDVDLKSKAGQELEKHFPDIFAEFKSLQQMYSIIKYVETSRGEGVRIISHKLEIFYKA